MTREEFGERFKAAREATGWTQQEVADRLGLPRSRIAEYETGVVVPPTLKLIELVESLELDPALLIPDWFVGR